MGNGIFAFGTTFTWNAQAVAELTSISTPKTKINTINVTSHGSTSAWSEFVAGLKDGGTITLQGNFYPGDTNGQKAMVTDHIAGTARTCVVTTPTTAPCTFTMDAIITDFEVQAPSDGKLSFTATLKVTGVPTFGYSAAPNLTNLVLTTATLVPVFAAGTYTYAATTTGTSFTVTPTCATADSITVNGNTVGTGVPSSAISTPAVGVYQLTVKTKKAGYVDTTYSVLVTKTA